MNSINKQQIFELNTGPIMAECEISRGPSMHVQLSHPPPPINENLEVTTTSDFTKIYDEAFHSIQTAQLLDEEVDIEGVIRSYRKGLELLQKALCVDCERLEGTDLDRDSAKQMQQKITEAELQVEYQLQSLQVSQCQNTQPGNAVPPPVALESPPSYEEAVSSPNVCSFESIWDSTINNEQNGSDAAVDNAIEIYSIAEGVQIFFITVDGYVSAPSYPSSLKIFKFGEDALPDPHRPPAFIQVGDWYYPLIPETSPVLHTRYEAYIFPDVTATQQDGAVGVILPETVSASERKLFEGILQSLTLMCLVEATVSDSNQDLSQQPQPMETHAEPRVSTAPAEMEVDEKERSSTTISKGIMVAADWISWGVIKGAEKTGQLIRFGSAKLKARIQPEESPRPIDPQVLRGMKYVREGADVAVRVSSFVVSSLGKATMALAKQMAPHIRKGGEKLLPKLVKSAEGRSKVDGIVEVAGSSLKGFGTVYIGLETAAKVLARNLACETVQIVDHKYGHEAGQLADNALFAVGNIAMAAYLVDSLGIKAVAKRAAKDTGKAVIVDIGEARKQNEVGEMETDDNEKSPN